MQDQETQARLSDTLKDWLMLGLFLAYLVGFALILTSAQGQVLEPSTGQLEMPTLQGLISPENGDLKLGLGNPRLEPTNPCEGN